MDHRIALHFEDGATRFIRCGEAECVADAAYRQKINVPMDCRDGVCGTCKAFLESGAVNPGEYIEDALTDDEANEGFVLACQCKPRRDCVIRILASSASCKLLPATHTGRIKAIDRLSTTTIGFTVALDDPEALSFLPGQYVNVEIPGSALNRSYSFSSPPGGDAQFLVRDVPDGRMSAFLRDTASAHAEMRLTGPYGSFYLRDIRRPILMLAGGTGLAPFLSMLEMLARAEPAPEHAVHLVYGVTLDIDLVAIARLDALAQRLPWFSFATCVADATSPHPRRGYVTAHVEPAHLHDGDVDLYVCGPPMMVEAVRGWMEQTGVKPANFFYEKFSAGSEVVAA